MSPAANAQIAMGEKFVAANFAANPVAAGEFVKGMCVDATEKLRSASSRREQQAAHALVFAALSAAATFAELTLGAGVSATANQPAFAARVAATLAGVS